MELVVLRKDKRDLKKKITLIVSCDRTQSRHLNDIILLLMRKAL